MPPQQQREGVQPAPQVCLWVYVGVDVLPPLPITPPPVELQCAFAASSKTLLACTMEKPRWTAGLGQKNVL
eukprot:1160718-Pelagomonas_calceolata.AAC.3